MWLRHNRVPARPQPCKRTFPTEAGSARAEQLTPKEFFTGVTTIGFPDGPCEAMPVPTGDLEAAFRATGAPNVVAYAVSPPVLGRRCVSQWGFGALGLPIVRVGKGNWP